MDCPRTRTFGDLNSGRSNNFDFLRFLLASLVIFSHSFPLMRGDNLSEPLHVLTGGQLTFGELAVNGFFILSGFLIVQSWESSRTTAGFFKKRILRIYPGYLAAVLFCAFVAGPTIASSTEEYWREFSPGRFVATSLNLNMVVPNIFKHLPVDDVNGSLWSIRYEFFCYMGVAFLGLVGAFRNRFLVLAAFALCATLLAGQIYFKLKMPGSSLSHLYCFPGYWPRVSSSFLAGSLFYLFRHRIRYSFGAALMCVAGLIAFGATPELKFLPLAFLILGTYLFFYVAFLPIPRLQHFAARGDLSYGMYLYAFPVQQILVNAFRDSLQPWTLFPAAFALTAFMAFLSWNLVEKWFLRRKPAATIAAKSPAAISHVPPAEARRDAADTSRADSHGQIPLRS